MGPRTGKPPQRDGFSIKVGTSRCLAPPLMAEPGKAMLPIIGFDAGDRESLFISHLQKNFHTLECKNDI